MNTFRKNRLISTAQRQGGLSLIELMVALVLGLFLMAGVIQLFLGSKQTYRFHEALSRIQENGRFAMEILSRDMRMTGYYGCIAKSIFNSPAAYHEPPCSDNGICNTLNNPSQYYWDFGTVIQGFEATSATTWTPTLDASVVDPFPGTDVITVRITENSVTVVDHPGGTPPGSAALKVPTNSGLNQCDILIVTNCEAAAIFQVTAATPGPNVALVHNTGAVPSCGGPGNVVQALGRDYTGGEVMRIATQTYYVRTGASGIPALWRRSSSANPQELLEGVQNMQILYGIGNNDQVIQYLTADAVDWDNDRILSVRINLLLVSTENNIVRTQMTVVFPADTGNLFTASDRRLYQAFSTTIAIRNRLP